MSTVSKSKAPKPPEPDPFRYGWRYVRGKAADGSETFEQIPLTLEDVLFPETGDFIVQTDGHSNDVAYLKVVFKARLVDEPTAVVVNDCRVDWNLRGVRPLGPDIAVFVGVKEYKDWATFNVAKEGARPVLVVEVTSPDTRQNDVGPKVGFYHQAKVPLYVIADVSERNDERHVDLIGYQYAAKGYKRIKLDAAGRIRIEPLGLSIGLARDARAGYARLACFELETGEEIGDYTAINAARIEAEEQARLAKREATAAKRKARALAKRLDEERARADKEARARADLEARVQELTAKLAKRLGEDGKPSS
jgi:Uma2 family endonuclease